MRIERGSKERYDDALELVYSFHKEALSEYALKINQDTLVKFFDKCVEQSFLLIDDATNKCIGLIAGIETTNQVSDERMFEEKIWYINQAYRSNGVYFFNKVQEMLKADGFDIMTMVCLANSKTEKLFKLYERLGFVPMEHHFMRRL